MNQINLEFNNTITRLAGFPYGEEIYNKQVANMINFNEKNTIIFPDNIEMVAISFVQGFFSKLVNTIGYDGIKKCIILKSNDDNLVKEIWNRLY